MTLLDAWNRDWQSAKYTACTSKKRRHWTYCIIEHSILQPTMQSKIIIYRYYKTNKIVRALWLAERRVCVRVCKHGCDVKMFCFSRANQLSNEVYFIYPFPCRLKLGKSLQNMLCQFFFRLRWRFKRQKYIFWKTSFFAKQELILCTRPHYWWELIF